MLSKWIACVFFSKKKHTHTNATTQLAGNRTSKQKISSYVRLAAENEELKQVFPFRIFAENNCCLSAAARSWKLHPEWGNCLQRARNNEKATLDIFESPGLRAKTPREKEHLHFEIDGTIESKTDDSETTRTPWKMWIKLMLWGFNFYC